MSTPTYNKKQKEAIEHIWGPLLVVAGPGTGKTRIIIERIMYILKHADVKPQNILALTFTESAAATMRKRLQEEIGTDAYRVRITTFHSFCNSIIETYPHYFPHIIGSTHVHEAERIHILHTILQEGEYTILKPQGDPLYYVSSIGNGIETLKREGIDPEEFSRMVKEERREIEGRDDFLHEKGAHKGKVKGVYKEQLKVVQKNEELAAIYAAYQKQLLHHRVYDFSDMIFHVIQAWKEHEDLLHSIQEQYQFVLVDEYQDTNGSQNRILALLGSYDTEPNICAVGDEKQAIFRFQGASIRNFSWFLETFPTAKTILLNTNYRSSQKILDAAAGVSDRMVTTHTTSLSAHKKDDDSHIHIRVYEKDDDEMYGVAWDIAEQIAQGKDPSDIAILYRNNKDSESLIPWLEHFSIPYVLGSEKNIFSHPQVEKYILLLSVLEDMGNKEALAHLLVRGIYGLHPYDVSLFLSSCPRHMSYVEHIQTCSTQGYNDSKRMKDFFDHLVIWKKRIESEPLLPVLYDIAYESESILLDVDGIERKGFFEMRALFDEIREYLLRKKEISLSDLLQALLIMKEHGGIGKYQAGEGGVGVRCLTAHGAKGREFESVYIINAYDKHWGGGKRGSSLPLIPKVYQALWNEYETKEEDDERRLFYVALTRAKKHVYISYAQYDIQGRDRIPTQFLEEIPKAYKKETKQESRTAPPLPHRSSSQEEKQEEMARLVSSLFSAHPFSVTALNNYLTCPWKYFYVNLLRNPQAKVPHLIFGTAIHEALRVYFEAYKHHAENEEEAYEALSTIIRREQLQANDEKAMLKKGKDVLTGFLLHNKSGWHRDLDTEMNIQVEYHDILLTGKIDKIERFPDHIRVVDYKTGTTRSRKYILGQTKESGGDIFRQLVFYKLLLETYDASLYTVTEGEIDFVEPTDAGIYKRELFSLTTDHVKELSDTIDSVAQDITTFSFWNKRCDDPTCEFCSIRYDKT